MYYQNKEFVAAVIEDYAFIIGPERSYALKKDDPIVNDLINSAFEIDKISFERKLPEKGLIRMMYKTSLLFT